MLWEHPQSTKINQILSTLPNCPVHAIHLRDHFSSESSGKKSIQQRRMKPLLQNWAEGQTPPGTRALLTYIYKRDGFLFVGRQLSLSVTS